VLCHKFKSTTTKNVCHVICRPHLRRKKKLNTCATSFAGLVSGVSGSLDALFFSVSFVAALFVADPGLFYWLMVASWGVTTCAAALYTVFYVRTSK